MKLFLTTIAVFLAGCPLWASTEIPGDVQKQPIVIVGATIHPVSVPPIENGMIVFDGGRIVQVGTDVDIPNGAKKIDATGKHVYPGLINTDGVLGLIEVNSVRATDDTGEVGELNMNARAEVAINPDSELIPVTRSGGVLMSLTAPRRGLITGTSALLQLDGWTTEDMTLHAPAGMHVRWPSLREADHHDEAKESADLTKQQEERMRKLEDAFVRAAAYQKARAADADQPIDLRWEAMLPVLRGEVPIIVDAERASQIQSAVAFANRHQLKLIIDGGSDAAECAALLKSQQVPVIVSGVYRNPLRRHQAYDDAFTLPARLRKAGVQFCISGRTRFDAANIRNLPYHAAMAIAFGLSEQDALSAITLWPAEILGVAGNVGSLDAGKLATLIIADGDIFHTATNITHAWIQGRQVDLSDRHKRLNQKYLERLRQTER